MDPFCPTTGDQKSLKLKAVARRSGIEGMPRVTACALQIPRLIFQDFRKSPTFSASRASCRRTMSLPLRPRVSKSRAISSVRSSSTFNFFRSISDQCVGSSFDSESSFSSHSCRPPPELSPASSLTYINTDTIRLVQLNRRTNSTKLNSTMIN